MKYLNRTLIYEIEKWMDRKEIIAIKGPRQAGKTTLLKMLRDYLTKEKKVEDKKIIYITFEDRDILDKFFRDPKEFVKSFISGSENEHFYFLIDEFQYLEEGGQKLKFLYDIFENIKFVITGSSSLELTQHTAKFLVGRIFFFELYQFSFEEFLMTKPDNIFNVYKEKSKLIKEFLYNGRDFEIKEDIFEKELNKYFEEYVIFGGYPEVIKAGNTETKSMILKNIYGTYIAKDIVELLRLGNISNFRTVVALLANGIGGVINYNNLLSDSKSYFKQIKQYISVLEETFIIRRIPPFFTNKTTELKKNPKIYFIDTGLRNYIINNFNELNLRADGGGLVENAVFSQLSKNPAQFLKYWRTTGKAEVDFILPLSNNKTLPIEVKYSFLRTPKITRGFRNFLSEYKPERAAVLTRGFWSRMELGKTHVRFIPVWYAV